MLDSVVSQLAIGLASRISGRRLSAMIFHRVLPEPDPLFPEEMHAARFKEMLSFLKRDWNIVPLGQALQCLIAGTLPFGSLSITFDDGYSDNATVALPILRAHGLAATFFVATGFLDGGRMWNDTAIESIRHAPGRHLDLSDLGLGVVGISDAGSRRNAIDFLLRELKYRPTEERSQIVERIAERVEVPPPADLMMTTDQVRALHDAGMEVGAHTVNHPILARLTPEQAYQEIAGSKARLEAILGETVTLFAYPNGKPGRDYRPEHATLVREAGFEIAVSTAWGASDQTTDPYQVPRFTPWRKGCVAFNLALAGNLLRTRAPERN